jgi:hypothetical protein
MLTTLMPQATWPGTGRRTDGRSRRGLCESRRRLHSGCWSVRPRQTSRTSRDIRVRDKMRPRVAAIDSNHAWISYLSYSSLTPATPGHIFSVTYDPNAGTATWTNLDGSGPTEFPDFPATSVAFDSVRGDLYASNDWGVLKRANGSTDWEVAAPGLPMVEVVGVVIAPNARKLYAATHGRSAWVLTLS